MSDPKIVTPPFGRVIEYKEAGKPRDTGAVSDDPYARNRTGDGVPVGCREQAGRRPDLTAFIVDGENQRVPVDSMPGVVRY